MEMVIQREEGGVCDLLFIDSPIHAHMGLHIYAMHVHRLCGHTV